ncbi:LOW QUALITY PROTEIN: F-box only protein 47-like [Pholidichthys leucotaenia]
MVKKKTNAPAGKYTMTLKAYKRTQQQPRPARTIMTRSQRIATTSIFDKVPAEVVDMILNKLSVVEVSVFCMASKDITRTVVDYISTQAWRNKVILQSFHSSSWLEQRSTIAHYKDLGLLYKRCTLLLPTKDRLKFIFGKFSQIPCFMLEQCGAPDCFGFSCYGVFLQALIAGWDELEYHRVFNFLCEITNLRQKNKVTTAKPGVKWHQELQVRLFCRQVLLDPCLNQSECFFWLMELLKPLPMVTQAHLLLILYALLSEGMLGWHDLVHGGLPHSALGELAKAIFILCGKQEVTGWTTNTVLAVWEELIVIPQPWHLENTARLLVLCGSELCYAVLASKALNGRLLDISRLIVFIILVCEKDSYHMSWVVKLVQQICKVFRTPPEKFYFIQHLESMFSVVAREYFEFSVAENIFEDQETLRTLCMLLDSSARFHTRFLYMLLK